MTSLFFGLLPIDLQIDILYVWLNAADCGSSLLKVLSALDVACSPSEQPSLRYLMGQLPPFGEYRCTPTRATRHALQYLRWLARRNVSVKSLLLAAAAGEKLESVDDLTCPQIERLYCRDSIDVAEVMQYLPNLTEIRLASHDPCCFVGDASINPNLKILTLGGTTVDCWLLSFGACPQLRELRIGQFRLNFLVVEQLEKFCPQLQLLEVSVDGVDFCTLGTLGQTCLSLEELVLHGVILIKVIEIAPFPNIRRITFLGASGLYDHPQMHISVIMHWADLNYLRINDFVYSRQEGSLKLPMYSPGHSTSDQLSRFFDLCSLLESFTWYLWLSPTMIDLLVDKLGATLKSLTVCVAEGRALQPLLERCGRSLKMLELLCGYNSSMQHVDTVCPLALIANTCPQLVSLSLRSYKFLETNGFSTLFAACGELKKFRLEILLTRDNGRAALQAIFQHKLRLTTLILAGGFDELDAGWFRQQARDHQLLPVPTIVVRPVA